MGQMRSDRPPTRRGASRLPLLGAAGCEGGGGEGKLYQSWRYDAKSRTALRNGLVIPTLGKRYQSFGTSLAGVSVESEETRAYTRF